MREYKTGKQPVFILAIVKYNKNDPPYGAGHSILCILRIRTFCRLL